MNPDQVLSYLEGLNPSQREAVCHGKDPLLILAGAGSGKTRVITKRIVHMITHLQFAPDSILAVTFTNKAAREMKERVEQMVPEASGIMIRTFHSFCAWLLRRNADFAGLSPHFVIYDDDDSLSLLKTLGLSLTLDELKLFSRMISKAKDSCLEPSDQQALNQLCSHPAFVSTFQAYEDRLKAVGNVDFGGLISKSVQLLRNNPGIKKRIQQKFQGILVDEYQDCNTAQGLLLKELYGTSTWLCVVGDDDQSIYRFRGADVEQILTFKQNYPSAKVIMLEQNYRSTGHILAIASHVVSNNHGRLGKTLWSDLGDGEKAQILSFGNQDEEAEGLGSIIRRSPLTETAILYRTNAQSRPLESCFVRWKIPYRIVGSLRFYAREEVKDILAWLVFILNPKDIIAFQRIVNKPARGLGPAALEKILQLSPEGDLAQGAFNSMLHQKGKARTGLGEFLEVHGRLLEQLTLVPLSELMHQVMEQTGLLAYHRAQEAESGLKSKEENLEELLNSAGSFGVGIESLVEYLERVELDQGGMGDQGDENACVTLITMHNTKGLEFERVFVTGLEEGLFPRDDNTSPEDREEERRLFYVAITRARRQLYFTTCRQRMIHGQTQYRRPSPFLLEVPQDHVSGEGRDFFTGNSGGKSGYYQGARVYHDDFGSGTIVRKSEQGGEQIVEVRFDTGRMGRFLPQYTPLEKISDE